MATISWIKAEQQKNKVGMLGTELKNVCAPKGTVSRVTGWGRKGGKHVQITYVGRGRHPE